MSQAALRRSSRFDTNAFGSGIARHRSNTSRTLSSYTRSGLVAGNDLAKREPGGFATIAVTPDHGCLFSRDSDADGKLDTFTEAGGFAPTVHVRLARSGTRLTGSCSSDGVNWTVVGAGTVPDAATTCDVELFVSAVNRHTGQEAIATFAGGITDTPSTARDGSGDTLR
ncbi:MAG TPA: hypothetical protein VGD71_31400, partial [Kribbella sp.]